MYRIAALLLALVLSLPAHAGSTVNPSQPSQSSTLTSSVVRNNFLATYNDINNILGVFAGSVSPANPTNLQSWADTTASPNYVFKYWNGNTSTWVPYAVLNINTNSFTPFFTSGGFLATAPVSVSVSGGVVTYSLNKDGNFATVGNNLALASIASGHLLANCTASTGEPTDCAWSAFADKAVGAIDGNIPYRASGAWGAISTGTTGHAIPFLDGANTYTAAQRVYPGAVILRNAQPGSLFRVAQLDGTTNQMQLDSFNALSSYGCMRADGTAAASTTLQANDLICSLSAHGYDGTSNSTIAGAFRLYSSQTWTPTAHGTYARITTTPSNTTTPVDAFGVENSGAVTVPPTVTGGGQGSGTINAQGLFVNGVAVASSASAITALTGDATATGPGSVPITLATVNSTTGSFGSSTAIPNFTVNAKGLVTVAGTSVVIAPAGTLTGGALAANVLGSSLTSVGTLTGGGTGAGFTLALSVSTVSGTLPCANHPVLTGDIATISGTCNAVLPIVNSSPGTSGSSTAVPVITTNNKGQVTSVSTAAPVVASSNITGAVLAANITNSSLQTVGSLTTGTWLASVIGPTYGGTGVNNGANTLTLASNVTHAGAFPTTITATGTTNSTLPSGTHTLAALDVVQSWTGVQSFANGNFVLSGATSGTLNMRAAAVSGTSVITWPSGTTDFSATGGASQFVRQSAAGAALTTGTILPADLPIATTGALGAVKPDGTTISISGGVITASGASATAITVGTTSVGGGTSGSLLYNNAGVLGNQTIVSALGARANAPTKQLFTSGSGTYTTPANVLWLEVFMIGGGGGGGGSGTTAVAGTAGTASTFGSSLLTANGGGAGIGAYGGASGGTAIGGANDEVTQGTTGGSGVLAAAGAGGGYGASGCYGGGGAGGSSGVSPAAGVANSGGGGGGGFQVNGTIPSAGGGGSGGCIHATINSPASTYPYAVGAAGTGGASTGGQVGGNGANGRIFIIEHYN